MIRGLISIAVFSFIVAIIITLQGTVLEGGFHPLLLNLIVYAIGFVIYGIFLIIRSPSDFVIRSRTGILNGFVASILISVVADLLVLYGLQTGSPVTWSMLVGMIPLGTYLLAITYLKESFHIGKLLAILISIGGALLVLYLPGTGLDLTHGSLFFLFAILAYSLSNIMFQKVLTLITVRQMTVLRLFSAAAVMSFIILYVRPEIQQIPWQPLLLNGAGLILVIVLANTIIHAHGASFFALGSNLIPVFTILISFIRTGSWPSLLQMVGCLVIVGSVLLFYSAKMSLRIQ
jgi:drug/metabolite transporter (DMT)-like permease